MYGARALAGRRGRHFGADFSLRAPNRKDEWELQKRIVRDLRAYLPDDVWYCCSLSGIPLPPPLIVVATAGGRERGAPDLSFIFWASDDDRTWHLEVKTEDGTLTNEQARLARHLGPRMRVARSFEDYRRILGEWLEAHGLRWLTELESLQRHARGDGVRAPKSKQRRAAA